MSNNAVKDINKKIDEALKIVGVEGQLEEPQYAKTRAAWEVAIGQAREQLKELRVKFTDAVLENSLAIFVLGPEAQARKFADLASKEGGTITIDAGGLYERFAAPVDLALGRERHFLPTHMGLLFQVLKEVGNELDVRSVDGFKFSESAFLPTPHHVREHVRKIVRGSLGDDFNVMYIKKSIGELARGERYVGSVVPIVVINANHDEVEALGKMFGSVAPVEVVHGDQEVDAKYVNSVFKNVVRNKKRG